MEKCRICLSVKRKLQSIFDSNNGYSFAFMMMSVAHIKIVENEGITEGICRRCSQKLMEAYDLKERIESSDEILRNSAGFKRINFTNLQDKIQMGIDTSKEIPQQCYNDIAESFKNGQSSLVFKNITIQKIEVDDIKIKKESEPLSVVDFLNSFKPEEIASYHDDDDFHQCDDVYSPKLDNGDPNYNLPLSMRKTKVKKRNAKMKDESSGFKPDDDATNHDDDDDDFDHYQCDDDYTPQSDESDDEDPDYNLPLTTRRQESKRIYKKRNLKKKDESSVADNVEFKKIHIKPVILKDVQVLPAIPRKTKERTKKKPVDKKYMCNYCGKMITSKEHLLTHTGVRSHKCDICSKAYLSLSGLLHHKKAHIQEKNFKCDKCVAAFTTAASLKSHYVMHLDENKFVCDTCSKSFKRRGALRRHKLIHNAANKCINCDLCNMSFFTKYGLKHHLRIHTGERPYKCEICSQPYSYKRDFNRHCLKKHGVFVDRRAVYVMNEEVLKRERALMRDLMLKMQGVTREDEPLKAFEGPQGALAFEMAIKALKSKNIPID